MKILLHNRLRGIDEAEEEGGNEEHAGNHVEGEVVVAGGLHEVTEKDATEETADVAESVHGSGDGSGMLLAKVDAEGPGRRKHEVEDAETEGEEHKDGHLAGNEGGEEHAQGGDGQRGGAEGFAAYLQAVFCREFVGEITAGDITNHTHDERYGHGVGEFALGKTAP